jgi:GNAT superfamily N-acetyltransferase
VGSDDRVRMATLDDLDALREVYRRASMSNESDRAFLLANLELSDRSWGEGRTIVSTAGGEVVGFATITVAAAHLELDALFVDPDHRRSGHATRLMDAVVDTARRTGVGRIEVSANEHARAFYEGAGFEQVGMADTLGQPVPRMHLAI